MKANTAIEALNWALGDEGGVPDIAWGLSMVNRAGQEMISLCSGWRFLSNREVTIGVTDQKDFVVLPSEVEAVQKIVPRGQLLFSWSATTMAALAEFRYNTFSTGIAGRYYAIDRQYVTVDEAGVTINEWRQVIRLWPAPSGSTAEAGVCIYDRGWVDVTDGEDELFIPGYMDTLFTELVKVMALGIVREEQADLSARLAVFRESGVVRNARARDGRGMDVRSPMSKTALRRTGRGVNPLAIGRLDT